MKKFLSALIAVMLVVSMCAMNVFAADEVVYVDGANGKDVADGATGAKDNPFNNLVDAFAALENGGTVTVIGDVNPFAKLNVYKTATDDDGNVYYTDETYVDAVDLVAQGKVTVTSDGGTIVFANPSSAYYNNVGDVEYTKASLSMNGGRVMFCGYNGYLKMNADCDIVGTASNYVYCTGTFEWLHPYGFGHIFANYQTVSNAAKTMDTVLILGGDTAQATVWNGAGDVNTNFAMYVKDNATVTTFHADGQSSAMNGNIWLYIEGNGSVGTINVDGHTGAGKAEKAYQSGGTLAEGFKATSEYPVKAEAVNENAGLFNKVEKEFKVTGDVNSLVTTSGISADAKLYAIVDGAAVEMSYLTASTGVYFSTIEGATNYVFADALKKAEEPKDDPSSVPTGDNMAIFAILGAVALAGAFTFKKVR